MDDHEKARDLADRFWLDLIRIEPMLGTAAGDERYDDRLSDPSESGRAEAVSLFSAALDELKGLDTGSLDEVDRTTMDLVEAISRRFLAEIAHRTDRLAPASHLWGPANLLAEVASLQRTDTPDRLERYLTRLRAFPAYLEAMADVARDGIEAGVTSPRVVAERSAAQVERILALGADGSPALLAVADDPTGKDRVRSVVQDVVNPAYGKFLEVLRSYIPHATDTIGLSALPGGDEMYSAEILAWTSLPLGAQEVHDLGVERFDSIQDERHQIAGKLGFKTPDEAIAARRASGDNSAPSPEALVKLAEEQVERSWERAPEFFGRMPSANCEVRRVEEFREADMPFAFYNSPTEDGSRPGIYYVNAFDLPTRDLHHLAAVTYHEANPGHHFQIALLQEISDRPALSRFAGTFASSAFCEGWGLYSERLADEMDLYVDDYERLGMLDAQAHRAGRLITDSGIHALGWSRDRAIAKLEEGGVTHSDSVIEIDRYIAMPGQALAYMIGMIEIQKARDAASERDGSSFSLRDFHDRILSLGELPLPALRREMAMA